MTPNTHHHFNLPHTPKSSKFKRFMTKLSQRVTTLLKPIAKLVRPVFSFLTKLIKKVGRPLRYIFGGSYLPPFLRTKKVRVGAAILASVVMLPSILIIVTQVLESRLYTIDSSASSIIDTSSVDTKLIKNEEKTISYNRASEDSPKELQKILTAAANKQDSTGDKPYQATLHKDTKEGITFSDSEGGRTITLIPRFKTKNPKLIDGRVIYPDSTNESHVYSFKKNGIKSDIVLNQKPDDLNQDSNGSKQYEWDLKLDNGLEAKLLPNGGIGIYGADLSYLTNATASDTASQELLDKAKQNASSTADKTLLIFELPAPFIVNNTNTKNYQDVSYTLDNNTLTLKATNLNNLSYPLSIDPTITVTTTADFNQNTGDTGNIDTSTADEIRRGLVDSGAVGTWAATTSFTDARYNHETVAYNGYLYVIGGFGSSYFNTVQYAPINANGTVGTWTAATTSFTTGRQGHTSVAYNGYLYVIGGENSGTKINDVQYAAINANGTIGTWTATTSFTTGREGHTSVAYNGYLYVIGGLGSGNLSDVQYAAINANGTIGSWTATTSFTTSRRYHTSVAYNGYLYVIGGETPTARSDVQYAPINANGTIGTWTATTSFTTDRAYHTSVAYNGYLYVIGGANTFYQSDVQYAPINANGTIGTWTATTSFTTARSAHASVAYNGYLYVIGGASGLGYLSNVQYSLIGKGRASAWATTTSLTSGRYGHTSVVYNNNLYMIGGYGENQVQYAPINANGTIGSWATTTSFTIFRGIHTSVAYNGYLYVIGGYSSTLGYLNNVQYAPINSNGTIGIWTATTSLSYNVGGHTSVAQNGYLYVIGGWEGTSYYNNVQYAPINANGTIGSWTATTSFTTGRNGHTSVAYNGYLYVIGGYDGSSLSDVQYAPINANGTIGSWTTTTSFTTARSVHTSVINNGYLYVIGGFGVSYLGDVQCAPVNANGTLGAWTTSTNSFTTARQNHASVANNGYVYVIGGAVGGSLNDVQYARIGPPDPIIQPGPSSWTATTSFTDGRSSHTSVVYNGYLYVIGGVTDNGESGYYFNTVQYAPINANGTIGSWATTTNLSGQIAGHTSVAYNGYLYVIGGYDDNLFNFRKDVQYAPINANGTIGSWASTTSFSTVDFGYSSVTYNGYLYVIGGYGGVQRNTVQYALINANGTLGSWSTTTGFNTARFGQATVVNNGYLYLIGGYDGSARLNDVQYALINANGTLGSWTATTSFTTIRTSHTSVAYNGYLYVMGGSTTGSATLNDVQYAPINANGTLGSWVAGNSFTTVRDNHTSVVSGGFLYVIGGGNILNDVQYAPIGSTDSKNKARYERIFDTGSGGNSLTGFTIAGASNCGYGVSYKTAGSSGVYGSQTTLVGVPANAAQTVNVPGARYIFFTTTLDDTSCGGQSTITSISLTYNTAPDAPTLLLPIASATAVSTLPEFRMGTTDADDPFIRYRIDVCTNSSCSSVLRTIDQTLAQTGWTSQSQQSGTAFPGGPTITQYAVHQYQPTALTPSTTYWWRAQAIDPGGTNQWSAYSAIRQFTTDVAAKSNVNIGGGTTIYGGTNFSTGP